MLVKLADVIVVTVAPGFSGGVPNSLVTVVLVAIIICIVHCRLKVAKVRAVKSHFAVGTSLPNPRAVGFGVRAVGLLLPSTFAVTVLKTVRSLLSTAITSNIAKSGRGSGARLVTRKTTGVVMPIFNNVPIANTVTHAVAGVGGNKHAPITNVVRTVMLLLVLLFLNPLAGRVPVTYLTNILVVISCGVDR